jgi:hypothetical protein
MMDFEFKGFPERIWLQTNGCMVTAGVFEDDQEYVRALLASPKGK